MKKIVKVKNIEIGGDFIPVQTMLTKKMSDVQGILEEIELLKAEGCHLVRLAVSSFDEIGYFKQICDKASLPIIADIQHNYKLAILAMRSGASKIRINPGVIGKEPEVEKICAVAKELSVPIRVGVNMGSLNKDIEKEHGRTPLALALSCVSYAKMVEDFGVKDIVLSVKASNVPDTIEACRMIDKMSQYPQHIGLTEAGTISGGVIKNAMAVGSLLFDNIGNTIRISLSAKPVEEVRVALKILKNLNKISGVELISCPTCSRCNYDLYSLAEEIERLTLNIKENIKIAVMGCAINGIGESRGADVGIVGGQTNFVIFKNGEIVENANENDYKEKFMKVVYEVIDEKATT